MAYSVDREDILSPNQMKKINQGNFSPSPDNSRSLDETELIRPLSSILVAFGQQAGNNG